MNSQDGVRLKVGERRMAKDEGENIISTSVLDLGRAKKNESHLGFGKGERQGRKHK